MTMLYQKLKKQITICIYDCECCFDSLWQEEILNDLYDAGIKNYKLSLLQKINETKKIAVKTHGGLSQRKVVNKITCQGEPWGPIECSVQIDGIGKESLNKHMEPYQYKQQVEIPALGWIDDLITVSESGHKTARMNSFINAQIAIKKLRLGAKKCFIMHIGNKQEDYKNVQLFVDGWEVQTVDNYTAGEEEWIDTPAENMNAISHIDSERYLGQIISSDSKNIKNITKLRNKGIGIKNKVIQMLSNMPGGIFHFEIAVIFRDAYIISSMLSNSEVWYGVTRAEIRLLEQVDEQFVRELFECSSKVATELLYLDLGLTPISYIIKTRKLMYLHHILKQDRNSLVYRFFLAQLSNPTKGDWVSEILEIMEEVKLGLELEEIGFISKHRFKSLVRNIVKKKAFKYLIDKKEERISLHTKGKELRYSELKMAQYLGASDIEMSIYEKKWLYKCRIEDIDLEANRRWNNGDIQCKNCLNTEMNQRHLLYCKYLLGKSEIVSYIPEYDDLFKEDIKEQLYISRLLKQNHTTLNAQTTM